ncbi:siderophore ABC transporter substrate-binding protein (plasmid) [Azospirillum humicireducens]|uniref:Siderophore ABC transporter substrate-binding protein n=1 Tax=Azospirillum humicireducens TaxID=1226968 RepID=A0A2R4VS14_9PROT|nr:ABC transporter substrate-binding protein [Azospirillum humicireducens]AWB07214.1 siderophore ABC transporter substrate-binding protein [Azospirillum humicireducens]
MPTFSHFPGGADAVRRIARRALLLLALLAVWLPGAGSEQALAAGQSGIVVTDMLGRKVTLPSPAKRIVLPEGRHVLTLGLLDKDPLSFVVAWGNDFKRYSPATFEVLRTRFPKADSIPDVGGTTAGSFSMEATIAARPDLVIFTLYGPPPDGLDRLDAAGIPYVFVDFFQKPLTNIVPSMRMLGALLDREREAESFIAYYESHMAAVAARLAKTGGPKQVFFHLNPDGKDCCYTSGPGNMSDFIAAAGGHNIGADIVPGAIGKISLEYLLTHAPDFYLAGGGSAVALNGLKVGPGVTPDAARQTMATILKAPGIAKLAAVENGRAGGVWLFFFDTPLFFVGVEKIAAMLHPAAFADLDPDRTMAEINRTLLAFPLEGTFWVDAKSAAR